MEMGAVPLTEVELVSGGLAVSLPGDRPAMLRGLSLRHDGPAVLIVDEASRVRDELWATVSPMLAAAPAAPSKSSSRPPPAPAASPSRLGARRGLPRNSRIRHDAELGARSLRLLPIV